MTGAAGLRVAYVVSRYPSVTHTFVLREVHALRARGVEVHTATVRRPDPSEVIGPLARAEADRTFALRPFSPLALLRAHLLALRTHPRRYLGTLTEALRDSPGGPRALVWQLFYWGQAVLLWDWMRSLGLRQVHAHHANVGADVAMIAARLGGFAWSFTLHGPTEFSDPEGHKLALKARRADRVIAISSFVREQLVGLGAQPDTVDVVHCGVEPSEYEGGTARADDRSPLRVLNVARMDPRKAQVTLVEAIAALGPGAAELTIVGDGPERASVERRAADLGVALRLAGAVEQERVRDFYAEADVFCLPSLAEGVPIVLMEAMASGVPVVATDVAGVPELVEHEVSGLLVPPGSPEALARALERLAGDAELRARLGAAGPRKVAAEFAVGASAEQLESAFLRLV